MASREQSSQSPNFILPESLSNAPVVYLLAQPTTNTPTPLSENGNSESLKGAHAIPQTEAVGFLDTADPAHLLDGKSISNLQTDATSGRHSDTVADYLSRYRSHTTLHMNTTTALKVEDFLLADQAIRKTQGCLGIGGNLHCKLVWNSDPMLRGFGILAYLPPYVDTFALSDQLYGWSEHATFFSGCPHVYVNLALDSSIELSVPYVGETIFVNATTTYNRQLGTFVFYSIVNPTGPAGEVEVIAQSYMKMSDITTFGNFADVPHFQMELEPAVEAIKKSKVVSSSLGSISSWLNNNKDDSVLGTVTRAAGWLTGGASKIADLMGWSKPVNVSNPLPIVHLNNIDMVTGDGTFTGLKYAQNIDAGVSRLSLSDNGKDQMMVSNFVRENELIPAYFEFTKDSAPGTKLHSLFHAPSAWYTTRQIGNRTQHVYNHLSFLCSNFLYWRGALDITIHPVMTKFHSGRIRAVYTPEKDNISDQVLLEHMSYTYSWIIDLSDPSSWTLRVPYISSTPWKHSDDNAGSLKFFVETPLHASAGVSSAIGVLLSVSLTDEFEVAVPDPMSTKATKFIPSMLFQAPAARFEMDDEPIKFVSETSKSTGAHQLAIGDPVRSLRAVFKRFFPAFRIAAANTDSHTVNSLAITASPWTGVAANGKYDPDFLTNFALCYAFSRGGMRFATNGYGTKTITFRTSLALPANNGLESEVDDYQSDMVCQTLQFGLDEPLKFELPWYTRFVAHNNFAPPVDAFGEISRATITFSNNATPITVSRAAADDFDMQFLVGPPPMMTYPRQQTTPAASDNLLI